MFWLKVIIFSGLNCTSFIKLWLWTNTAMLCCRYTVHNIGIQIPFKWYKCLLISRVYTMRISCLKMCFISRFRMSKIGSDWRFLFFLQKNMNGQSNLRLSFSLKNNIFHWKVTFLKNSVYAMVYYRDQLTFMQFFRKKHVRC